MRVSAFWVVFRSAHWMVCGFQAIGVLNYIQRIRWMSDPRDRTLKSEYGARLERPPL